MAQPPVPEVVGFSGRFVSLWLVLVSPDGVGEAGTFRFGAGGLWDRWDE